VLAEASCSVERLLQRTSRNSTSSRIRQFLPRRLFVRELVGLIKLLLRCGSTTTRISKPQRLPRTVFPLLLAKRFLNRDGLRLAFLRCSGERSVQLTLLSLSLSPATFSLLLSASHPLHSPPKHHVVLESRRNSSPRRFISSSCSFLQHSFHRQACRRTNRFQHRQTCSFQHEQSTDSRILRRRSSSFHSSWSRRHEHSRQTRLRPYSQVWRTR